MKYLLFGLKVVIILAVISVGYYFGYLKPHQVKVKEASAHYSNLVENRNAYINLAKLNSSSADFDIQKANLIDIIRQTNSQGLKNPLSEAEKSVFERQNEILNKVFATKSYEEGVVILKSEESVKLLLEETNLINQLRDSKF